jgi:hypothetical protein
LAILNREPHRSTETALEIVGEGLGALGVAAVSGGQDGPLARQAGADRGTDPPGAARDQRDPAG